MTRARSAALLLVAVLLGTGACVRSDLGGGELAGQPDREGGVLVLRLPAGSFAALVGVRQVRSLAVAGGAAVLVHTPGREGAGVLADAERVDGGEALASALRERGAQDVLVVVTNARGSGMDDVDEPPGVVVARGVAADLLDREGTMLSLSSDSTRRAGLVTDADIAATVASFRDEAEPRTGSPVRFVDTPAPLGLYERHVQQRRLYVPIGTAAVAYVAAVAVAALVLLATGRRGRPARVVGWACLTVPALATALLAAGHLPRLTYANVVPFVAIVTVLGTLAFSPLEGRDLALVPAGIGLGVLAYLGVETLLGWSATLTPLLGGSAFDGVRFYGMPNVAIGLVAGSALWAAQALPTLRGVALVTIAALLAGLPLLGANLGAAVTLFAAAGLWLAIRERARLGVVRGVAAAAAITVAGTALVLVAHRLSPVVTHVSRFEGEASGISGLVERFASRLQIGLDLIARNPAAVIPVLGLPVLVVVLLRPPASLSPALERWPAWRDALLATSGAGIVAYLANDTGPAAAGLAFGLAVGGLFGVSLLSSAEKMDLDE